jgi:sugar O-acyltransferase (sialic acid O-acetyltransferase NeuD family)
MTSLENNKTVNVLGAGGHARAVIALLTDCGFTVAGIYDPAFSAVREEFICGVRLKGALPSKELEVVLAIGDGQLRKLSYSSEEIRVVQESIIHPEAFIGLGVNTGISNLIFPRAVLHTEVKLGANNIINTGCILEHETVIGNHNHISVGTVLCGRVTIGDNCFVGAGTTIIDKVKVGSNVTIGAGSVVIRDILEPGVYVGNPARRIR